MPVLGAGPDILLTVITPCLIGFWSAEKHVVALKHGGERLCVLPSDPAVVVPSVGWGEIYCGIH